MVPAARRAIPTLVSLASLVVVLTVPVSGEEYALRDHGSGLTTVWFYDPNTMGSQLPSNWKDYLWVGKPTSVALGFELTANNCTSYFDSPFAHDIVGRLTAQGFDVTSVDYAEANGPVSSPDDLLNATNRRGTPLTPAGLSLRVTDGTSTYYLIPCYGGPDRVPYYLDEDSWPAKGERTVIWVPTTSGPVPFLLRGADEPNALLVVERPGSERLDLDGDGNPDVDLSGLASLSMVWMLALTIRTVTGDYLLVQGPDLYYEVSPDEHLLNVASFRASDVEFSDDGTMKLKLHIGVEKGTSVSLEGVDLAFLDRDGTALNVTPSEGDLENELLNSLKSALSWDSSEITLSHPSGDIREHLPAIITLRVMGSTELTDNLGNTSQFTVMASGRWTSYH
ncbi:hypothetical protein [Methanopyrus kandleri]|uniref:Uncharacterized secreted protein specific for M.kandleri, MK-5 family n=1 Tax=Methanopyrus kandleri (strain AV19 / DSM 6324 / JCM 9639 / NBRC 100938) TaxID=190192 RepID=Q8TVW5_METKA|nr:hypothetical protein [Methanopyrus kandleri]AAM02486.1 Uncharacterized secreted protein specific for M.kandleri, MK-5 family [Methanopyrus kandleri AV19]